MACYILNDIILSITIGEKDNQRETSQLMTLLESQSSTSDLKINISELKSAMEKLGTAKEKEEFIKESRKVFRRFLSPNPILKS